MDREELAIECLAIESCGGNVLEHLKDAGCISPRGTWYRLQREQLGRKEHQITEGRGDKAMAKPVITDDNRREAVRIALEGGSPYDYFRAMGLKAPETAWIRTKSWLKKEDPDAFHRLPKTLPKTRRKAAAEDPADVSEEAREEDSIAVTDVPEGIILEEPAQEPAHRAQPLRYMGYTVETIRDELLGSFHYDAKHQIIDWTSADRLDELSVDVSTLRRFLASAPSVFGILGVDLHE